MMLIADQPERLDRFLARSLPEHSRSKLVKLIEEGEVLVEGRTEKPSFILKTGSSVELSQPTEKPAHDLTAADIPLNVLYEDDSLLVVDKPRGMASHPAPSLKEPSLVNALLGRGSALSSAAGTFRPGIVHRLDKETTGLMVVAKTDSAHVALAAQIESKSAQRRYFAVVAKMPETERFVIDAPLGRNQANRILMAVRNDGKRAVTHFKVLRPFGLGAILGARLETGRTHQIRIHLSSVGMPVLGDRLYAPARLADGPLQLHSAYLEFTHPVSLEVMKFFAPPGQDFAQEPDLTLDDLDPF